MRPYLVLGTYKPSRWRASIVGRDLTDLTHELGLVPHYDPFHGPLKLRGRNWSNDMLHAEVRCRTFSATQAEGWHFDGDLEPKSRPDCAIVTWASNTPTEIKWKLCNCGCGRPGAGHMLGRLLSRDEQEEIYRAKPYEVVIFRNLNCLHRRPANAPRLRWLFRQRVELPPKSVLELL